MPASPLRYLAVLFTSCLLLACGTDEREPPFNSTDITGANYARGFTLTDHTGARRTLEDYKGKVVTVFFGFTQCPDVCPTALSIMSDVMKRLGSESERVQVLFITVDPERDTQEMLAHYAPAFDERFVGLYGTLDETAEVAKEFRVYYAKAGDTSGMNYTIDHSTGTFVFDTSGKLRLHVRHAETAEKIAEDLQRLLAEG